MNRRTFLAAAVGVGLAGCSDAQSVEEEKATPTLTPAEIPGDPDGGPTSRFNADDPCPPRSSCFHRQDATNPASLELQVDPERFTADERDGELRLRCRGPETWIFESDYRLLKYTGHRWARISHPRLLHAQSILLEPGDRFDREFSIENRFGVELLGEGRYACAQAAYAVGAEAEGGKLTAALFEVEGTSYEPTPTRDDVDRDGETVRLNGDGSDTTFVVERGTGPAAGATELVPEVVGARSLLRETVPRLGDEIATVRATTGDASRGMIYLQQAAATPVEIDAEATFQFDGVEFGVRIEEAG